MYKKNSSAQTTLKVVSDIRAVVMDADMTASTLWCSNLFQEKRIQSKWNPSEHQEKDAVQLAKDNIFRFQQNVVSGQTWN